MELRKAVTNLATVLEELRSGFARRAAELDETDTFAAKNIQDLKDAKVLSAMVPAAYGGGGASFPEMCDFIGSLAQACPSTALCLSMHCHVVASNIVNASLGRPGEALLRKVAETEAMVTTTVANDWIASNGTARPVEGGYEVHASKSFVSGAPAGDILITSVQSATSTEVLHFAVPYGAAGLQICGDWRAHGMRATGTLDVMLDGVFVPEEAITLRRPVQGLHPVFHVILTVAPTLIMASYMGIAARSRQIALASASKQASDTLLMSRLGRLERAFVSAQLAFDDMVDRVDGIEFTPSLESANETLVRKTIVSENVVKTCELCSLIVGGGSYRRSSEIERLLRDARAAELHPMTTDRQFVFTGHALHGQ